MHTFEVHRMQAASPRTNPDEGVVRWSPIKSVWFCVLFVTGRLAQQPPCLSGGCVTLKPTPGGGRFSRSGKSGWSETLNCLPSFLIGPK